MLLMQPHQIRVTVTRPNDMKNMTVHFFVHLVVNSDILRRILYTLQLAIHPKSYTNRANLIDVSDRTAQDILFPHSL